MPVIYLGVAENPGKVMREEETVRKEPVTTRVSSHKEIWEILSDASESS